MDKKKKNEKLLGKIPDESRGKAEQVLNFHSEILRKIHYSLFATTWLVPATGNCKFVKNT